MSGPARRDRRDFLIRCCRGASAAFIPSRLRGAALSAPSQAGSSQANPPGGIDYRVVPHYRQTPPLESVIRKVDPGLDAFVTEKYAAEIEAALAEWTAALRQSPANIDRIASKLSPLFQGSSLRPVEEQAVRSDAGLQIHRLRFSNAALDRAEFIREFRSSLAPYSNILTAEFLLTDISVTPESSSAQGTVGLETRVRYDLVGSGPGYYRQQRVGSWEMEWEVSPASVSLRRWRASEETRSQTTGPVFVDITSQALAGNASYAAQLLPGCDTWRTVLDRASGIDIYGHNGVAVGDFDNDGFDDLYVCQPSGLPNRLYRNRGDGTFEDVTERAGVGVLDNTACALFADVDNDGWQDLIVVRADGPALFLNRGDGTFAAKADAFHFAQPPQGTFTSAALADYNCDGWLDIYFCLYVFYQAPGQYRYPTPYFDAQNGPPNFLLRNNRDGTFTDVTEASGLNQNNNRYSFACAWGDYNNDGWPDLYVANDFGRKNLYRNNGDGTFTDVAAELGVEDVGAGMSACWFDDNNDGNQDLYVADMWTAAGSRVTEQDVFMKDAPAGVRGLLRKHAMGNSLFQNDSGRGFRDASAAAGVAFGRWAWSSDAWDFDQDGYPDLYITNGMVSGPQTRELADFFWRQVVAQSPVAAVPSRGYEQGWSAINDLIRADGTWNGYERNVFYANNRDGSFSDVSGAVGLDFVEDARAFALADFDHDGRMEICLKNRNAPQLRLLRNVMRDLGKSISFRLRGTKSNRDAIGASVTITTSTSMQTKFVQAGSGYLTQHTKDLFFGLGQFDGAVTATIRWPSGISQRIADLSTNLRFDVVEGTSKFDSQPFVARNIPDGEINPAPQKAAALPDQVETWLLAPTVAPDFSLPDLQGNTRTLSEFRGRPLLLNFWAAYVPACTADLELFQRRHFDWAAQGLQLATANVDSPEEFDGVTALARNRDFAFPILRASEDVIGVYNLLSRYMFDRRRDLGLPTSFLIDESGAIVKVYQGPLDPQHLEFDFRHIPRTAPERLAAGLPFPGISSFAEFHRNYFTYGLVFFDRGYLDHSEKYLRLALQQDPQNAEALYVLGSVYLNRRMSNEARESFERVTKLPAASPDTLPNAWNNLGLLSAQAGQTEEAIRYFNEALRLAPEHSIALQNLGNAYRRLGRWQEAREALEHAVGVNPEDAEANYSLGMVYAQQDDTERAYEHLHDALTLRPNYPEALNNLGVLYLRTDRKNEAVATFEECIRVAPTFDQSYLNLAKVHTIEGEPEKARAVLLELLKQRPDDAAAQKALEELPR